MSSCSLRPHRSIPAVSISLALLLTAPAALAQEVKPDDGFVPADLTKEVGAQPEVDEDFGWDFFLRTGLSGSFASSSNVVGAVDGTTWTLGGLVHHGWYYITRSQEWRNDTRVQGAFARTPLIDDWVKSSDKLDFLSMYIYRLPTARWLGPFGRFRLNSQVFPGADVRPEMVTYVISRADGTVRTVSGSRLHLTDSLSPLTLRQTAGAFIKPETPPAFRFEALAGLGVRQTFADGQLIVTDDKTPGVVEVSEIASFNQAGTEIILNVSGELDEGRFGYATGVELMTPFLNDVAPDDGRSPIELTNIEARVGFSLRPYDWLSIDFEWRAFREPQLLDEFQVTTRLLVGVSYTLIERGLPPAS